jgi:hypothetical protein
MTAPTHARSRPGSRRPPWATGLAASLAVLAVAFLAVALWPRAATATASLSVTPRTEAGADAALLLADRYAALAGAVATLRAAREGEPALAGVGLEELEAGTTVERAPGSGTIAVRVSLADPDDAVTAANAVVGALVAAGAAEELVDVDPAAEATPARTTTSPDPRRWSLVALVPALGLGLTAAAVAGRRARSGRPPAAAPSPAVPPPGHAGSLDAPDDTLDDLPGFLEHPPGSVPALSAPAPSGVDLPRSAPATTTGGDPPGAPRTGASAVPPTGLDRTRSPATATRHPTPSGRGPRTAAVVTAVGLLVAVAVGIGVAAGRPDDPSGDPAGAGQPTGTTAALGTPGSSAAPDATAPTPDPLLDTAAGALAFRSVPLGEDGVAASVAFQGVVLEQRAVGLTVTYPSVSVTTDGRRSLAHVRLPTFNCLADQPPADPVAAGCARSLTEYADLTAPALQVTRDGDRVEVTGLFPTYTRPNGAPPGYTGRAYQLTATVTADGPRHDAEVPAAGVVRIGADSAPTTTDPGVNLLQLPR